MIAPRRHKSLWSIATALFLVLALFACKTKGKQDPQEGELPPDDSSVVALSASATPNGNGITNHGVAISITVRVSGGTPSYTIDGESGSFTSPTHPISRTYSNTTSMPTLIRDKVTVRDSAGAVKEAEFIVGVYPAGMSTSTKACAIVAAPVSPVERRPVLFNFRVFNATPPYTFAFRPGTGQVFGIEADSLEYQGYAVAGLYSAQMSGRDRNGQGDLIICSLPITVRQEPSVALSASPSTTAAIGSAITLTATASNFLSSNITYSFRSVDGAAQIQQSNNTATVTVNDGRAHTFPVEVTATANGESATRTITLKFQLLNFTCSLSRSPSGDVMTGTEVAVTATSSTGNGVSITSLNGNGISPTNPARITYATSGQKTVLVKAEDSATGTKCNDGADLSISFNVRGPVQCTVSVPPSGDAGSSQGLTASVEAGTGFGDGSGVKITNVTSTQNSTFQVLPEGNPARRLQRNFLFGSPRYDQFHHILAETIEVTVLDESDPQQRTAKCTASHTPTKPCMQFQDLAGNAIAEIRAHNQFNVKIDNPEVYAAYTHIDLGAATDPMPYSGHTWMNFPATTGAWRYTQNHGSTVTGQVDYLNVGHCTRPSFVITPALACSISARYLNLTSEISFSRTNSPHETGTIDGTTYYGARIFHQGNPASPVNPGPDSTVNTSNKQGTIAYRFNANNGSGWVDLNSANASEAFSTLYPVHGAYPQDAIVSDSNDPYQNTCRRSDDSGPSQVTNRVEVDGVQFFGPARGRRTIRIASSA